MGSFISKLWVEMFSVRKGAFELDLNLKEKGIFFLNS